MSLFCTHLTLDSEKAMAPHSSTLAWKIPWTEEPGRVQSMGSQRVGHDWATSLSLFTFMHWRRKWQPTRVLAWRIPGTGEPGGLLSMESHRVGHYWSDLAAAAALITCSVPQAWILTPSPAHLHSPKLSKASLLNETHPGHISHSNPNYWREILD